MQFFFSFHVSRKQKKAEKKVTEKKILKKKFARVVASKGR